MTTLRKKLVDSKQNLQTKWGFAFTDDVKYLLQSNNAGLHSHDQVSGLHPDNHDPVLTRQVGCTLTIVTQCFLSTIIWMLNLTWIIVLSASQHSTSWWWSCKHVRKEAGPTAQCGTLQWSFLCCSWPLRSGWFLPDGSVGQSQAPQLP